MNEDDNYTIVELFEMLKKDESWESDPQKREGLAKTFYRKLIYY